jgi:hypothetical protein
MDHGYPAAMSDVMPVDEGHEPPTRMFSLASSHVDPVDMPDEYVEPPTTYIPHQYADLGDVFLDPTGREKED